MKTSIRSKNYGKFSNIKFSELSDKYTEKYYENGQFENISDNIIIQTKQTDFVTKNSVVISTINTIGNYFIGNNSTCINNNIANADIKYNSICINNADTINLGSNSIFISSTNENIDYSGANGTIMLQVAHMYDTIIGDDNILINTNKQSLSLIQPLNADNTINIDLIPSVTSGDYSICIGNNSGYYIGCNCIALGRETAAGYDVGNSPTENSIMIGYYAGFYNTFNDVICIGNQSGLESVGENTIAIGYAAGEYYIGQNSIAVGAYAAADNLEGQAGIDTITIGTYNTRNAGNNSICIGVGDTTSGNYPDTTFCLENNVHIGNGISTVAGVSPTNAFVIRCSAGDTEFIPNSGYFDKGFFLDGALTGKNIGLGAQSNNCLFYDPETYQFYYSIS